MAAKKNQPNRIEVFEFDDIHRGTTMTLPIIIRKSDGTLFDLTGFKALFTLKAHQSDYDYDDDRALIAKEFEPYTDDPNKVGRIDITLTSKDLWQPPGLYYFDIVLMHGASSARILLASTNIVGGPANREVRHDLDQADFFLHDPIEITPTDKGYIAVQVPFVTDPPENIVEGVAGDPHYLVQQLDDPHRHVLIRNYGPRLSLMMTFRVLHDGINHRTRFDQFFLNGKIPAPCPLRDGYIEVRNRKFQLHLAKDMAMVYQWNAIQHNHGVPNKDSEYCVKHQDPEEEYSEYCVHETDVTYDGGTGIQRSSEPIYLADRTMQGSLTIHLCDENDQIHMTVNHFIPDDMGDFEWYMVRVDWFNWVDPYEPDPERDDVSTHFPETNPVADTWEGYWPPDMWYCYHEGKKE